MATQELTHAVARASEYLLEQVREAVTHGTDRLPTVKELARAGHYSPGTLVKALAHLRRLGVVSPVQRGGIRIVGSPDSGVVVHAAHADTQRAPARRWEQVRRELLVQLGDGTLRAGSSLSSVKELRARMGVSFSSVKKALESLCAEGRLVRYGRGYRVRALPVSPTGAALVLIAHSDAVGDLGTVIPRNPEFLRLLERECLRLNLSLLVRTEQEAVAKEEGCPVVGYVVWIRGIHTDRLVALLARLEHTRLPVAVMDEDGTEPLLRPLERNARARQFLVATSSTAGQAMGELLVRLGHRRASYLTPVGMRRYCRIRYEGLARAFEDAGMGGAVDRLAPGDANGFEGIVASHMQSPAFVRLTGDLEHFARTVVPSAQASSDKFYTFYTDTYLLRRAIQTQLFPVLDRAVLDRGVTALVGVNDWTALVAMAHARERGVRVPEDLSIAGFDDTFEAFSHGLTSYDYNMPALVGAMLEHILSPPPARRREPLPPLEVPGIVRMRMSTPAVGPPHDAQSVADRRRAR